MENRLVLSENAVKRHSKRLQEEIKQTYKPDFTLSEAQNMLSRVFGMTNWHELKKVLLPEEVGEKNTQNIKLNTIFGNLEECHEFILELASLGDEIYLNSDENIAYKNKKGEIITFNLVITKEKMIVLMDYIYESNGWLSKINCGNDISTGLSFIDKKGESKRFAIHITGGSTHRGKSVNIQINNINKKILELNDMEFNEEVEKYLTSTKPGIVLINGTQNSGVKDFISAIISSKLNSKRVLIYETMHEYSYNNKNNITLSEVGRDLENFTKAIYNAMGRKPDLVFIQELRDEETLQALYQAYMSGLFIFTSQTVSSITGAILRIKEMNKFESLHSVLMSIQLIVNQKKIKKDKTIFLQEYLPMTIEVVNEIVLCIENHNNLEVKVKELITKYGCSMQKAIGKVKAKGIITSDEFNELIFSQ